MSANVAKKKFDVKEIFTKYGIVVVLLLMIVVCSFLSPVFATANNLINILRQVCVYSLLAYAEGSLIISGAIDLSAGSMCCFLGILAIPVYRATSSSLVGVLFAIVMGIVLYCIPAFFVAVVNMPAFVVGLALQISIRGFVKVWTGGVVITQTGENFSYMGQGKIGPVPIAVIVMIVCMIILHIILEYTTFGRQKFAVGGNPEAARASGINVAKVRFFSFLLTGAFVGLAGYMAASRVNGGLPTSCTGYEGQGISASVIGGVAFGGGQGKAWNMLIGAILVGVISNILNLMAVDSYVQEVINGLIILVAVWLDMQTKKVK